jgi:hypothetical protein
MAVTDQAVVETAADAFNAHDLERLSALLHEDVVFRAPGGIEGEGRAACVDFYRRWFAEFPDARVDVHTTQIVDDIAVEEAPSPEPTPASRPPAGRSRSTTSRCCASGTASTRRSS